MLRKYDTFFVRLLEIIIRNSVNAEMMQHQVVSEVGYIVYLSNADTEKPSLSCSSHLISEAHSICHFLSIFWWEEGRREQFYTFMTVES